MKTDQDLAKMEYYQIVDFMDDQIDKGNDVKYIEDFLLENYREDYMPTYIKNRLEYEANNR